MKKTTHLLLLLSLFLLLLLSAAGCAKQDLAPIKTVDDLSNKRIGICSGTIYDKFTTTRFPAAQVLRYNEQSDLIVALKNDKIDAAITNFAAARHMLKTNQEIGILSDEILTFPIGIGFNKNNPDLRNQFNKFLKARKADGSLDSLYKKWFENDLATIRMPDYPAISAVKKIKVGVAIGDLPSVGYVNGEYVGLDIELIRNFAQQENLQLEFVSLEFGALIASLASGKVDMIADCIAITEERQKQVDFSSPYMVDKTAAIVMKKNMTKHAGDQTAETPTVSWFSSIADRAYSNILHENRYLLILDGLKTTMLISVFSLVFGTLLGAGICYLRMSRRKVFNALAGLYISVMRGIPVLVLLMITYYIIFASANISPILVAILSFGMNFAAYVAEMFRTGIESIDKGQTEAGIAGGFTPLQTFVYIVMPQATNRILPVYKGEVISLVKMTSIVGYVAVQDLTKASDIIRSRTFDAFFPLVMTAILYFAISWVLLQLLNVIETRTDPKQRRREAGRMMARRQQP